MKPTLLYLITCRESGRRYAGITSRTLHKRWTQHVYDAGRASWLPLHAAIRKHGRTGFLVEPLFLYPSREDAAVAEREIISQLDLNTNAGYNATPGGDGAPTMLGKRHRPETIEKMRAAAKNRGKNPPRNSISPLRGRPQSPEERHKRSMTMRGRAVPQETREKLRAVNLGKKHSAESRAKMSVVQRGRKHSSETLEKMRRAWDRRRARGPVSEETRAKLRAAALRQTRSEASKKKLATFWVGRKHTPETREKMRRAWDRRRAAKLSSQTPLYNDPTKLVA